MLTDCFSNDTLPDYMEIKLDTPKESSGELILRTYSSYEYIKEPLFFLETRGIMTEKLKLDLIAAFEEWYGSTDQETTEYALEFEIIVRMIINNAVVLNPTHLDIVAVLDDICSLLPDDIRNAYRYLAVKLFKESYT